MATFASPFFQNILSLTENCVPIPPLTTYEIDYVDPKLRTDAEAGREYIDPETQNTLRLLNLIQKAERIPTKVNYCTPESFEAGKKYQDQLKKQRLCSKRITTYMTDYQNPHQRKSWFELNAIKMDGSPLDTSSNRGNGKGSQCIPQEDATEEDDDSYYYDDDDDEDEETEQVPKWKREGWNAKKKCWLRPLKERRYYYETLQFKTDKKRLKKGKNRCEDDD